MAKKNMKNPFKGREGMMRTRMEADGKVESGTAALEEDNLESIVEEMRRMEKILGPDEFRRLLSKAIDKSMEDPETQEMWEAPLADMGEDDYDEDWGDDEGWNDEMPMLKEDWTRTHPADLICASDQYYADLANELAGIVSSFPLPPTTPDGFSREVGKTLAAYLEDVVTGLNVFSAMRRVCRDRYGYLLPFYDCTHDEYMPDHLNEEDIRFLIWKTICMLGHTKGTVYSPLAPGWELIASRMFDELNDRFEEAPEAVRVRDWVAKSLRKGAYIDIREIAIWLVLRNPMTCFPGFYDNLFNAVVGGISERELDLDPSQLFYGAVAREAWQRSMSPMGCPSRTLVAAMATEFGYNEIATEIEAIRVLPQQTYKVTQERKPARIIFEDVAHKQFTVERDSFAKGFRPDETKYANCVLVHYQGKYLLNGLLMGGPELKKRWETEHLVPTAENMPAYADEWIDKMEGQQVICVTNLKKFLTQLDIPTDHLDKNYDASNYICLLSRELGMAFLPDAAYAFKLPNNRFFRKRKAEKDSFSEVVFHNAIPHDVAVYIQQHELLPEAQIGASQGKEVGRSVVQKYLSFWIGFYRHLSPYGSERQLIQED